MGCYYYCVSLLPKPHQWCTPYLFPQSSSEHSSMILRWSLQNMFLLYASSYFVLLGNRAVFTLDGVLQSWVWCLPLLHFIHIPFIFCLYHTSLVTNSSFIFSLSDSPPVNWTHFSIPHFLPWPLPLWSHSFFWNLVLMKSIWSSFSFHLDGSEWRSL